MKHILIYNIIPDKTEIYCFENLSQEDQEKLEKCHGHFGGQIDLSPEQEMLTGEWLPQFLVDKDYIFTDDTDSIVAQKPPSFDGPTKIIYSGFLT